MKLNIELGRMESRGQDNWLSSKIFKGRQSLLLCKFLLSWTKISERDKSFSGVDRWLEGNSLFSPQKKAGGNKQYLRSEH